MDYYSILGIDKNASQEEISKAYREAAVKYHPDKNPNDEESAKKFKACTEAFEVLNDPVKKRKYDAGSNVFPFNFNSSNVNFNEFEHVVSQIFGGGNGRNKNVLIHLEISFLEAAHGCTKQVSVNRKEPCPRCSGTGAEQSAPCPSCHGQGRTVVKQGPFVVQRACDTCHGHGRVIKEKCADCMGFGVTPPKMENIDIVIPAGIESGMQIRVKGKGEAGRKGVVSGDLFVVVIVAEHELFKRNGADVFVNAPVSYSQLVLGVELDIPSLDGKMIKLTIPPNTQSHTRFKLDNLGVPNVKSPGNIGHLFVDVILDINNIDDKKYLRLIKKLGEFEAKNPSDKIKAFKNTIYNKSE